MKMRNMKIIGAFAVLAIVLGLGVYSQFRGGRDTGLTQADKILKELSSMPVIDNVKDAFKGEEFQKEKKITTASKPKTKKGSYVFSTTDESEEPGYINDLKYSGIEVRKCKKMASISNVMDTYYQKQGYPKLEKKMNTEIPQNAIPGQLIVKSLDWQNDGTYKVNYHSLDVNPQDEAEAIAVIKDDPNVVSVEPNIKIKIKTLFAIKTQEVGGSDNDPYFDKQWALKKGKIDASDAWKVEKGSKDIKIAILDTGCDLEHPDLKDNLDLDNSYDYANNDNEPEDKSENSHGTHVAGIIAAETNGIGVQGVMQKANLIISKILENKEVNITSYIGALKLANAITSAIVKGARVINMSWGTDTDLMADSSVLKDAFNAALARDDVLLVAAAGNEGKVLYPAKYTGVLAVTGTDKNDKRWVTTTTDPDTGIVYQSAYGSEVDVSAPAEDIYSTIVRKQDGSAEDGYGSLSGTSMSAAFVSGLAGLLLSQNPDLTKEELIKLIKDNVDPVTTDADKPIGTGRINAQKALEAIGGEIPPEGSKLKAVVYYVGEENQTDITAKPGDEIQFYGNNSVPPDGYELSDLEFQWDFGDGSASDEINPKHTYNEAGEYTVILVLSLGENSSSDSVTVTVQSNSSANTPPVINAITYQPQNPKAGEEITFTADASDPDGTIQKYSWDFNGDGEEDSTDHNPSYSYSSVGNYTVTLTVTDDGGATAQDSVNVDVGTYATVSGKLTVSGVDFKGGTVWLCLINDIGETYIALEARAKVAPHTGTIGATKYYYGQAGRPANTKRENYIRIKPGDHINKTIVCKGLVDLSKKYHSGSGNIGGNPSFKGPDLSGAGIKPQFVWYKSVLAETTCDENGNFTFENVEIKPNSVPKDQIWVVARFWYPLKYPWSPFVRRYDNQLKLNLIHYTEEWDVSGSPYTKDRALGISEPDGDALYTGKIMVKPGHKIKKLDLTSDIHGNGTVFIDNPVPGRCYYIELATAGNGYFFDWGGGTTPIDPMYLVWYPYWHRHDDD